MEELLLTGKHSQSRMLKGVTLEKIPEYLAGRRIFILTDTNLADLYSSDFPSDSVIVMPPGEGTKELVMMEEIYNKLFALGADRSSFLLGIGGGVVCDITGFIASTYMRGISFGFVPTSLLAQVDASIGGKNGVNLGRMKNMIGVIKQPEFIFFNAGFLRTLPDDEFRSGLAEVVKHALIRDVSYFSWLGQSMDKIKSHEDDVLEEMVWRSVLIKKKVVEEDEQEKGVRRILNFGHTAGHAIEKVHGLKHGVAVAYGMLFALFVSVEENLLSPLQAREAARLILGFNILEKQKFNLSEIIHTFSADKKKTEDRVNFILLNETGNAVVKIIEFDKLGTLLKMWVEKDMQETDF